LLALLLNGPYGGEKKCFTVDILGYSMLWDLELCDLCCFGLFFGNVTAFCTLLSSQEVPFEASAEVPTWPLLRVFVKRRTLNCKDAAPCSGAMEMAVPITSAASSTRSLYVAAEARVTASNAAKACAPAALRGARTRPPRAFSCARRASVRAASSAAALRRGGALQGIPGLGDVRLELGRGVGTSPWPRRPAGSRPCPPAAMASVRYCRGCGGVRRGKGVR